MRPHREKAGKRIGEDTRTPKKKLRENEKRKKLRVGIFFLSQTGLA